MSRFLNSCLLAASLLGPGLASLHAASNEALKVKIPFEFVVDGQKMPAGEYRVQPYSESGLVMIQDATGHHSTVAFTTPSGPFTGMGDPSLVFSQKGSDRVLSRVQFLGQPARLISGR